MTAELPAFIALGAGHYYRLLDDGTGIVEWHLRRPTGPGAAG